jgi:hypothetical protein
MDTLSTSKSRSVNITIAYKTASPLLRFAAQKLDEALHEIAVSVSHNDLVDAPHDAEVVIIRRKEEADEAGLRQRLDLPASVPREGFHLFPMRGNGTTAICVYAHDDAGAMYGTLELAEQLRMRGALEALVQTSAVPRFGFRAIKFNLPWSPYRSGPATDVHLDLCRDLAFWACFLDMMAENRFNVLSLWNLHPFTYMFRPTNFPEACPFSDAELQRWKGFWRSLFRMAKERGIETYVVNWNIVVSPEFAKAHGVQEFNDTSELVKRYTRECVTQLIDQYDDLTGVGVTLADWMNNMTPKEREDWIEDTFIAGMKAAKRPVKFIHRSVLAGSPVEMRRVIDNAQLPDPVLVEIKFNWSHGHSTPTLAMTHDYHSGAIDERFWKPRPTNYEIIWMIRNEDFFILRWGEPDFMREHIRVNGAEYVGGYFVGSEGYIPAQDYSHRLHKHKTWRYAFEKQWLFYMLWGRILYEPATPDSVFEAAFERRYGQDIGRDMLKAYKLASRMPMRLASFHAATWDYTLYSEGFLAPVGTRHGLHDGVSAFISIDELIDHRTLEPTYLSIADYVASLASGGEAPDGMTTPLELADELERNGNTVIGIVVSLRSRVNAFSGAYECELDDLEAWAHLSLYCADKLRAGVALATFRKTGLQSEKERAIALLQTCVKHWGKVVAVTDGHYRETPHVSGEVFSWANYRDQVDRDVAIAKAAG